MVETFRRGTTEFLDIVIDYDKKKVDFINPKTQKKEIDNFNFKTFLHSNFFRLFVVSISIWIMLSLIVQVILILQGGVVTSDNKDAIFLVLLMLRYFLFFAILMFIEPIRNVLVDIFLYLEFDIRKSKFVVVKDINTKTWKFPYDYYAKLNYKLFGDYAKYIKRFESKSKDWYWKKGDKLEKQEDEAEAIFYFRKIPKTGRMEIEFL